MPRRRMVMKVTSSGTSGTFSQVGFDLGCIWAEVPMVLRLGWRHRLISFRPANYVVLGYKPDRRSSAGVTRTMFGMTFFAPPLRRFYALRWQGEGYVPDLDGAVEALERFSCSPFPTRIVGFPSYLWFGLKRMEELASPCACGPVPRSCWPGAGSSTGSSRWTSQCSTPWSGGCWGWGRRTSMSCSAP